MPHVTQINTVFVTSRENVWHQTLVGWGQDYDERRQIWKAALAHINLIVSFSSLPELPFSQDILAPLLAEYNHLPPYRVSTQLGKIAL